jgi:4-hydroxybenzoyl-CoA thioesterase
MLRSYTTRLKVRFGDVDPGGIVFYPRYFEMLNGAVEDWFAERLEVDFATMHRIRRIGVPTVALECNFVAPSELCDVLFITITPTRVGRSSCALEYRISGEDGERLRASAVLVCMDLDTQKAVAWPADIRSRLVYGLEAE